jgi:predicted nucleotidyltransferase
MVIHRALDEVFRSWSHVAVLRALLDTAVGFTGNEVARVAGMHPRSALKALTALEALGLVHRQRGGRDHLFTLNREHFLIRDAIIPLFESERRFPAVVASAISALLGRTVISATIFGSVARKEETAQSDVDLCCVVKSRKQKDFVREKIDAEAAVLYKKYGVKLAPVIFTLAEFKERRRNPLVRKILSEGRVITGKSPKVLLHG